MPPVVDMSQFGPAASAPAQSREVRGEEADIAQTGASTASSAATAERTRTLLPAETQKAETEAERAAIDLGEARRSLAQAQRRGRFSQAVASDNLNKVLGDIAAARRLIQGGMATGPVGQFSGNLWGSPAATMWGVNGQGGLINSITAPGVMNELAASREGSAAGATPFGQLAIREMELVRSLLGNLAFGNSDEENLRALDDIEQRYRRAFSYGAGIDPRTEAGAQYAGLPYNPNADPERNPRGAAAADADMFGAEVGPFSYILPPRTEEEASPPPTSGDQLEQGAWTSNPELTGVDAAVSSLIQRGVASDVPSAEIENNVRAYLDSVQPGLGERAGNISTNIRYHKETGRDPGVTIERSYQSAGERPDMGTAYVSGMADVLTGGTLDELTGKGAELRGLQEENPGSYFTGQALGGLATSLLGGAGVARMGLNVPWYMQGAAANTIYGAGSADEGNRIAGALTGLATTPVANVAGQAVMRPVSSLVGGTLDRGAQLLAQRYGVDLAPGSVSPGGAMSWLENRLADLPITSGPVAARNQEAVQSFNEAAFNRALEPIGGTTAGRIGREGVTLANQQVDQAYRQALDGVAIGVDPARVFDDSWLQGVQGPAADSARRQLAAMRTNLVSPGDVMTGAQVQEAKQSLQSLRRSLANADGIEPAIVRRVDDLQDELYDAFEAQAPENFALFRAADQAFGNMQTVQNTVMMAPGSLIDPEAGRVFLPSGLSAQARQGDIRYRGRRAAAEGEGAFAEMADLGERLVQPRGAGSMRNAVIAGTTLGIPAAAYMMAPSAGSSEGGEGEGAVPSSGTGAIPASLAYSALTAPLLALPFTRGGSRAYSRGMTAARPEVMQQLGGMLQRYAAPAAGSVVARPAISGMVSPTYPQSISLEDLAAQYSQPEQTAQTAPSAQPVRPAVDTTAPSTADTGVVLMRGRPTRYDPAADVFVDIETGEVVDEGEPAQYRNGGRVARKRPVPTRALKG
jgi:hypothetical protein